jgi:hypothetical protein
MKDAAAESAAGDASAASKKKKSMLAREDDTTNSRKEGQKVVEKCVRNATIVQKVLLRCTSKKRFKSPPLN